MTDDSEKNTQQTSPLWILLLVGFVMLFFILVVALPSVLADLSYKSHIDMKERTELPFSGCCTIISEYPLFGGVARLEYNTSDTTEIRIVERPDKGGFIAIPGKLILNGSVGKQNLSYYWSYNPCVSTDVFILEERTFEHAIVPQYCICG